MKYPEHIKSSRFVFDILNAPDKRYTESIPEMLEIESWRLRKDSDFNEVVRYILFMYDKGSSFIKKYTDIKKRREQAIIESGIKEERLDEIADMVTDFLVYQNDRLWHIICIHQSLFIEYSRRLMGEISEVKDKDLMATTKIKEEIRQNLIKVHADLEKYLTEFYQGDTDLKDSIETRVKFTPENISRQIK